MHPEVYALLCGDSAAVDTVLHHLREVVRAPDDEERAEAASEWTTFASAATALSSSFYQEAHVLQQRMAGPRPEHVTAEDWDAGRFVLSQFWMRRGRAVGHAMVVFCEAHEQLSAGAPAPCPSLTTAISEARTIDRAQAPGECVDCACAVQCCLSPAAVPACGPECERI